MKEMHKISLFFAGILMGFLLLPVAAAAQEPGFKEHVVIKGDTLWDISEKEMADPFLWPKVWKENPEIKNPDLIYPGQKVRIPLPLTQKAVEPKPLAMPPEKPKAQAVVRAEKPPVAREIPPIEKKYLIDKDTLIASGYIAESVPNKGLISGAPTGRSLFGKGDFVYINPVQTVRSGEKFYILRPPGEVRHPATGAKMGHLIEVVGAGEVVGEEGGNIKLKIAASYSDVLTGDILTDYYEIEQPFLTGNPRTLDLEGFIVATRQRHAANANYDIVYVDVGRKDGVEIGDVLNTVSQNRYAVPNGTVQVISTKEKTATAVVRKVEREVMTGDRIGKP